VVCYGHKIWFTGSPVTIGDVFFYPGSKERLEDRLDLEDKVRSAIGTPKGADVAEQYGPDLLRHEAVHSDQWAQHADKWDFVADYLGQPGIGGFFEFAPRTGSVFEQEANLYWGGYREYFGRHQRPSL
jgi:hypothetical protein